MEKDRILVVDDEYRIRNMIKEYMESDRFIVDEAGDGREALEMFMKNPYSLIILDIMMPEMDGWSVCREIRRSSQVPIIMLTARGEEYDKLFGFELGVDDYVVKPFSPKELLARVKAVIKRSKSTVINKDNPDEITVEGLSINFASREVKVDGDLVNLTPKEFELLSFFVKNPNRAFTREQLLNQVWGYGFYGDYRTVDTHVKMLRESLKGYRRFIKTVWGIGYKFQAGGKP